MSESRDIRDPILGFIRIDKTESNIVNSSIFQRLRKIRQLAFANLVYPGALHTRFEHSLGVCHIAGLLANALDLKGDEQRLIRLAALLHDIGHVPFSHVSEEVLEIYTDRKKLSRSLNSACPKIRQNCHFERSEKSYSIDSIGIQDFSLWSK